MEKFSLRGREQHRTLNLVYLVVYISVMLLQFSHPPTSIHDFPYVYVWAAGAVLYPLCLSLMKAGRSFWWGLVTVLLITVTAQVVQVVVYLMRTGEYRYGDTDSIVWAGFYLVAPAVAAIIWYPIGYVASWLFSVGNTR